MAGKELCVLVNMPMLSKNCICKIARDVEKSSVKQYEKILTKTREKMPKILKKKKDPSVPEDKDINVSSDCSW